jgi:hypothetical protein
MPALRERPDDIPLLARHFMQLHVRAHDRPVRAIAPETMAALSRHSWQLVDRAGRLDGIPRVPQRRCRPAHVARQSRSSRWLGNLPKDGNQSCRRAYLPDTPTHLPQGGSFAEQVGRNG